MSKTFRIFHWDLRVPQAWSVLVFILKSVSNAKLWLLLLPVFFELSGKSLLTFYFISITSSFQSKHSFRNKETTEKTKTWVDGQY
jgi:hypothetical protein